MGKADTSRDKRSRVKLVFLIPAFRVGGAQRVIARLSKGLDDSKYDLTVVGLKRGDSRALDWLPGDSGICVVDLGARSKVDIYAVAKLFRLFQRERVDILYTFMFHAGLLGRILGRLVRVPIVLCSERNIIDRDRPLRKLALRLTWRFADHFTVNAEAIRDYLLDCKVAEGRISIIRNGLDLNAFPLVRRDWSNLHDPVIGCVANLESKKGYDDWLKAASIVSKSMSGTRFRIVGDGPERERLHAMVRASGLSDRIEFLGYRVDIIAQLAQMHIYVQSSRYEGMPNAVIEAMATGLPVVATDVGGTGELVIDGVTGFLVQPSRPDLLAEKALYLLQNPDVAERMGRLGRQRVETHFSLEQMVCETEGIFRRYLLEKRGLEYVDNRGWVRRC